MRNTSRNSLSDLQVLIWDRDGHRGHILQRHLHQNLAKRSMRTSLTLILMMSGTPNLLRRGQRAPARLHLCVMTVSMMQDYLKHLLRNFHILKSANHKA
uniref:Uncharacterized protein n=1 Tax=Arundo donax TaxID=35708 RepID=A0A0A9HPE1_ARUDO